MTLVYLDTSAVIQLFIREPFTPDLQRALAGPGVACATSDLTYAESHGWFSKALTLGRITQNEQRSIIGAFNRWFDGVSLAELNFHRVRRGGERAIRHHLRGGDALHLVTATEKRGACANERRIFACFDERLTKEARARAYSMASSRTLPGPPRRRSPGPRCSPACPWP